MICVSIGRGRHKHVIAEHAHLVEHVGDQEPGAGVPDHAREQLLIEVARRVGEVVGVGAVDHDPELGVDGRGDVGEGLAELGLFGLSIPEERGGFGLSMQGVCSAVGHLAYHDRSDGGPPRAGGSDAGGAAGAACRQPRSAGHHPWSR